MLVMRIFLQSMNILEYMDILNLEYMRMNVKIILNASKSLRKVGYSDPGALWWKL